MAAFIPAAIQAAATLGSGYLAGKGQANPETKMQRTKRKLVDKLLGSLNGSGPFADLYGTDQEAFNKSFVEPAQAMFRNKIAPQIQQSYIASGQQRGTGLDDTLTRAGVDLDSMLNQHYLDFQNQGKDRKQNTLNSILGMGDGAQNAPTNSQNLYSAGSGFLSSDSFADFAKQFAPQAGGGNTTAPSQNPNAIPPRKGFQPTAMPEFSYTR